MLIERTILSFPASISIGPHPSARSLLRSLLGQYQIEINALCDDCFTTTMMMKIEIGREINGNRMCANAPVIGL